MKMRFLSPGLTLCALALSVSAMAADSHAKAVTPALDKARVSRAAAEKTALATVPGGSVKEAELEQEKGKLVWSFDITTPKTKNVTEVQVDALRGKVVSTEIETPADQAREKAADASKAARKSPAK